MADTKDLDAPSNQIEADTSDAKSIKIPQAELADLTARATAKYAVKDYLPAAELYSQATELQAEINGEMNVENADLLYAYGRCLFYVAQKSSTVLGGTAAQVQLQKDEKKVSKKRTGNGILKGEGPDANTATTVIATDNTPQPDTEVEPSASEKPYFQFQGDENFEDSSSEEDENENENEEEEDDFATSFELLDLARVLYGQKLELIEREQSEIQKKGKEIESTQPQPQTQTRYIKGRISDIYDLQAEISLEGEKYSSAVTDLKSRLLLTKELEPPESELLAECHYKLSLALEAAAQDQQRDAEGNPVGKITIDWDVRNEAIAHQQEAIDCCMLRVEKEKAKLLPLMDGDPQRHTIQEQVDDVQEMVVQMQDRLADLKKPPVSATATAEDEMSKEMMAGVLGQVLSSNSSKEEQKDALAKVMATATDLSSMVKKKKRKVPADDTASNASGVSTGSKRKVQFVDTVEDDSSRRKTAKVEDAEDSGL